MNLQTRLDTLLQQAVDQGRVPGVVALATTAGGVLALSAAGERNLGGGQAMTADTVFWVASMTKALTALAALQLVEQGRLALDDPAPAVVPALAEVPVFDGWQAPGRPRLRPPRSAITLRQLLTHTSGFAHEVWHADMVPLRDALGLPPYVQRQRRALQLPLATDPGTCWAYGIGIDWVGLMIEAVTGQTLGQALQQQVLGPLGMASTGFHPGPDLQARLAGLHQRGPDGHLQPQPPAPPPAGDYQPGGGGLYSTLPDYARFLRLVLNGGQLDGVRLLQPASMHWLLHDQMAPLRVQPLRTAVPARSNDAEFWPGVPKGWSLAFQVNLAPLPTGRAAGGLMWAGLGNTYYWLDPARGVAGALATQILPFADPAVLALFEAVETAVYDSLA